MKKFKMPELFNIIKLVILVILILLELAFFYFVITYLNTVFTHYYIVLEIIAVLVVFHILSSSKKYVYKLSWTIFLILLPLPAIMFYILFGEVRFIKKITKCENEIMENINYIEKQDKKILNNIDANTLSEINSIYKLSNYKAYDNINTKYFSLGEYFFEDIIKNLKEAEHFILIEFYILAHGYLYDEVKQILIDKANEGVKIYLMYDKLGSMGRFFKKDEDELKSFGINVKAFNSNILSIFEFLNYRSHRKLVVIDGKYAYTGGINLADEYINKVVKYGHWKDMGIRIDGQSTYTYTKTFFKAWILNTKENININEFKDITFKQDVKEGTSLIVPFTDGPTNPKNVAEHNYMKIISNAKDYVYIATPYLIIDEEMVSILKLSANSGVDVRILVPGVADKKLIYEVSKSHFRDLINSGVQIYTYTGGFVHGKLIISDDRVATVGSINFDYRSLLWNYECGVYVNDKNFVLDVKEDFLSTVEKSQKVNEYFLKCAKFKVNYVYGAIKLLGPLL